MDDTALDPPESEAAGESGHRLVLSTIHSAKGLEWTVVFVIGLAVGRFPGQYVLPPGEQWEEERRLFYVAATRAKKRLFLSFPREMFNSGQRVYAGMSSFVAELKPVLYQTVTVEQQGPARAGAGAPRVDAVPEPGPASAASSRLGPSLAPGELLPGMRVGHAFFGPGTISRLPAPGRVEVLFDRHGSKILHLDYARLSKLVDSG